MSWSVFVSAVVAYRATCNETECIWQGTLTDIESHAEREAAAHREGHEDEWKAINLEWEGE